ncbi:MAG: hypothetical protein JSR19_11940 [Proteobacteria bacterium]|nr:hypothetical protein [Pseudomonadota bacterium]HQR04563.1 hypothetical protein [Rhodocyclaceae bacterium]
MSSTPRGGKGAHIWRKPDGAPVSCTEKIKVLNQNYGEIRQLVQDALDDAVLMGCSETQVKDIYRQLLEELHSAYPEQED